jgi:hypothetical protein
MAEGMQSLQYSTSSIHCWALAPGLRFILSTDCSPLALQAPSACVYNVSAPLHYVDAATPAVAANSGKTVAASIGVTLIDDYFSAWECRTILSPWADPTADAVTEPQPACAIIL